MPHFDTFLAHAGLSPDADTGALVPPLHLATTFERASDGSYPQGYVYRRLGNPTVDLFQQTITALEGGSACAAFGSGMAAATALLHTLRPGDHVVLANDLYYGVRRLATGLFHAWGLTVTEADLSESHGLEEALRSETRLVWVESPSNPMLKIVDLEALAMSTHAAGGLFVVDSTWAPPPLQRPLDHGADYVIHSVTKYLAGHSDVLGGVVIVRDEGLAAPLLEIQQQAGSGLDPFSAWLALRGLRSLAVRLRTQCANAHQLAEFLAGHPRVRQVYYPGLPSHPGHTIALQQMQGFGGMLSFEINGEAEDAMAVAARVRLFRRATSLGGTESLIEHRASIEPPGTSTPETLLRLSIGLEHIDDLVADLAQALG